MPFSNLLLSSQLKNFNHLSETFLLNELRSAKITLIISLKNQPSKTNKNASISFPNYPKQKSLTWS